MEEKSLFLDFVGDSPRMRVLQLMIEGRHFDYTITDLLKANVSWGTLNTLVPKLQELGILIVTRRIGRATLYQINDENFVARLWISLYDKLLDKKLLAREKMRLRRSLLVAHQTVDSGR